MNRLISYLLFVSLVIASSAFHLAAQTAGEHEIDAIRQDVSRLFGLPSKKVKVRLRSGASVKGYIDSVDAETFTLTDDKSANKLTIKYADVAKIKTAGTGMSKNQKTALILGATAGTLLVLGLAFRKKRGPWDGLRCLFC